MKIRVLGAAAGGGFPQWNCNCPNCDGLRKGKIPATARTQSSIAVSPGDGNWVLFNASPDILAQLKSFPALQPARAIRDTAIVAVVLLDSQIDHTTGLLMLREGKPLQIYCTDMAREDLTTGNPLFNILGHYCGVEWHRIPTVQDSEFSVVGAEGLKFSPVALKSKAPPYSPHRNDPHEGDNTGMQITDLRTNKSLFYAPGLGEIEPHLQPFLENSDCLLVDGTCWSDDELIKLGISKKRSRDMGHLPQSGEGGMMSVMEKLEKPRKILIHINNTNPILNENSAERKTLDRAGIEIAYDGMEINL
jgi:pyrroloquinoline quinone biosynthesis protein B